MEFHFDISEHIAKDKSVKSQMLKVTNHLAKVKQTRKHIQDNCFAFPFADIYIILKVNSDQTFDLVKSGGDEYEFSYNNMGEKVASNLFKIEGKASGEQQSLERVPSINGAGDVLVGDSVQVGFYDSSRQKPYIRRIVKRGNLVIDPGQEPNPGDAGEAGGLWPQAAASIRKDWLGYTNIDFSDPELDAPKIGTDWPILLEIEGSDRFGYFDFIYPNILVVEETYTDLPATDVNKDLVTLVVFAHRLNGLSLESYLYLYKLKGRTDVSPSRGIIDALFNEDFPNQVSLPIQAWALPVELSGVSKIMLPTISNGYARTYNNTLHLELDGDGNATDIFSDIYDRVHVTFIQPPILQIDGIAPVVGSSTIEVTESFTCQTDDFVHNFILDHSNVTLLEITIDEEGFGEGLPPDDYLESYSITGDFNNVLTVDTFGATIEGEYIQFTIHVRYSYMGAGTAEVFNVFEANLGMLSSQIMTHTSQLPSVQVNGTYHPVVDETPDYWTWNGFMGSTHISLALNSMVQAHIAGEKAIFSRRAKEIDSETLNWMTWKPVNAPAWNELIPEMDSESPKHRPAYYFFNHTPTMNNAPAKIKDANIYRRRPADDPEGELIQAEGEFLEDGFLLPYYSFYGDHLPDTADPDISSGNYGGNYRSILWLVYCMLNEEGAFSHNNFKLLERTNPGDSDFTRLDSIDGIGTATIKSYYESLYSMTFEVPITNERYKDYYCPEVVDCDSNGRPNLFSGYGGTTACEDPCFDNCERSPESSGCFCWMYEAEERHRLLGVDYTTYHWGGYIEGNNRVQDTYGNYYPGLGIPDVNKQGLNNVLIPLPLSSPNLMANNLTKSSWTARSSGTGFSSGDKNAVDPQIAVAQEDGMIYMVIIEAHFLYLPSTNRFIIDTSPTGTDIPPDPEGYPEPGEVLCGNTWTCWIYSTIYTSCEGCSAGPYGGEGDTDWGYVKEGPYTCSNEVILHPEDVIGDTHSEYTAYGYREVVELRETKLVISNKSATSVLTVPICKKFSGIPVAPFFSEEGVVASEELPIPENCWQIALWKGFVLLLIDAREEYNYSPRPVLQIHDRFTGIKVAEYKTIIPDAIYEDRYPLSVDNPLFDENSLKTKWKMWGRQVYEHCPGPRFKLAYQPDKEGVTGDENKPLFIHISADIYEIPSDTGPTTIKSRREYRILKFDGAAVTEVRNIHEEKEMDVTGSTVDQEVVFPNTYPSPGALDAMAISEKEVFLPAIKYDIDDSFDGWKLISHQITN